MLLGLRVRPSMTSFRKAGSTGKVRCRAHRWTEQASEILGKPYASELPALVRIKEVAVGRSSVTARRRTASTSKDVLAGHEFAVVFANCARYQSGNSGRRGKADPVHSQIVTEHLLKSCLAVSRHSCHWTGKVKKIASLMVEILRCAFPFGLCREPSAHPSRICICLVEANVLNGGIGI